MKPTSGMESSGRPRRAWAERAEARQTRDSEWGRAQFNILRELYGFKRLALDSPLFARVAQAFSAPSRDHCALCGSSAIETKPGSVLHIPILELVPMQSCSVFVTKIFFCGSFAQLRHNFFTCRPPDVVRQGRRVDPLETLFRYPSSASGSFLLEPLLHLSDCASCAALFCCFPARNFRNDLQQRLRIRPHMKICSVILFTFFEGH